MITQSDYRNEGMGLYSASIFFKNNKGLYIYATKPSSRDYEETNKDIQKVENDILNNKPIPEELLETYDVKIAFRNINNRNKEFQTFINNVNQEVVSLVDDIYTSDPDDLRDEEALKIISNYYGKNTGIKYTINTRAIY